MTKSLTATLGLNLINIAGCGLFLYGFFTELPNLTVVGGLVMIYFFCVSINDKKTIAGIFFIGLILEFFIKPWYTAFFWSSGLVCFFQIPSFIIALIFNKKEPVHFDGYAGVKYEDVELNQKSADKIYSAVDPKRKQEYQKCFDQLLSIVDLKNETNRAGGLNYDVKKHEEQWKAQAHFIDAWHDITKLDKLVMYYMLDQFYFAEPYDREIDKGVWIDKVMFRDKHDYFPSTGTLYSFYKNQS